MSEHSEQSTEKLGLSADPDTTVEMPEMPLADDASDAAGRVAPGIAEVEQPDEQVASPKRPAWKRPAVIAAACVALVVVCAVGVATAQAAGLSILPGDLFRTTEQAASEPTPESEAPKPDAADDEAEKAAAEAAAAAEAEAEAAAAEAEAEAEEPAAAGDASASQSAASGESSPAGSASSSAAAPAPAPAPEPEPAPAPEPATITVSVYVDSSRAASYGYASCLASTSVTLPQGASVYDALCATGVGVGGSGSYVSSIGGLAEFSCGPTSGWLYYVNGVSPGYGSGGYTLYGGESITWVYTLELGSDV